MQISPTRYPLDLIAYVSLINVNNDMEKESGALLTGSDGDLVDTVIQ